MDSGKTNDGLTERGKMESGAICITNIQRFSLHDGPGIRTTVFCKGCSLCCPWCANPENIRPQTERYVKDGKPGVYGRAATCDELYEEIAKDRIFYDQRVRSAGLEALPGGVTFSGGEPLLQFDRLEPLLRRLKAEGMHICAETALFVPEERLETAITYVDLFYIDVKLLDPQACRQTLSGCLSVYLRNVKRVFDVRRPVVFRVPVIGGYTDGTENRRAILRLLGRYRPLKVELIKGHNLGRSKYASLGRTPPVLRDVTDAFMEQYAKDVESETGIPVEICKI